MISALISPVWYREKLWEKPLSDAEANISKEPSRESWFIQSYALRAVEERWIRRLCQGVFNVIGWNEGTFLQKVNIFLLERAHQWFLSSPVETEFVYPETLLNHRILSWGQRSELSNPDQLTGLCGRGSGTFPYKTAPIDGRRALLHGHPWQVWRPKFPEHSVTQGNGDCQEV